MHDYHKLAVELVREFSKRSYNASTWEKMIGQADLKPYGCLLDALGIACPINRREEVSFYALLCFIANSQFTRPRLFGNPSIGPRSSFIDAWKLSNIPRSTLLRRRQMPKTPKIHVPARYLTRDWAVLCPGINSDIALVVLPLWDCISSRTFWPYPSQWWIRSVTESSTSVSQPVTPLGHDLGPFDRGAWENWPQTRGVYISQRILCGQLDKTNPIRKHLRLMVHAK